MKLKIEKVPPDNLHGYWSNRYSDAETGEEVDVSSLPSRSRGHVYKVIKVQLTDGFGYIVSSIRAWDYESMPIVLKLLGVPWPNVHPASKEKLLAYATTCPKSAFSEDVLIVSTYMHAFRSYAENKGWYLADTDNEVVASVDDFLRNGLCANKPALLGLLRRYIDTPAAALMQSPDMREGINKAYAMLHAELEIGPKGVEFNRMIELALSLTTYADKVRKVEDGVEIVVDETTTIKLSYSNVGINGQSQFSEKGKVERSRLSKLAI